MNARLTFGEYMRRLRRKRKWSLNTLAEHCGLSYPHLSRLENDSTTASVESVARLAQALNGDLKIMLELADCLPRLIFDRISSQEASTSDSLMRTAGLGGNLPEEPVPGIDHPLAAQLQDLYHIGEVDAGTLALAIDRLVNLEQTQRASLISLISSLSAQGGPTG